jgi:hypothetical protein
MLEGILAAEEEAGLHSPAAEEELHNPAEAAELRRLEELLD